MITTSESIIRESQKHGLKCIVKGDEFTFKKQGYIIAQYDGIKLARAFLHGMDMKSQDSIDRMLAFKQMKI